MVRLQLRQTSLHSINRLHCGGFSVGLQIAPDVAIEGLGVKHLQLQLFEFGAFAQLSVQPEALHEGVAVLWGQVHGGFEAE